MAEASPNTAAPQCVVAEGVVCKNCNATVTQKVLRCGVCKKASYCSNTCQKEDWKFHKRICKKYEPESEPTLAKPPPDSEEIKRQLDELTKDQEPGMAKQLRTMAAGMLGAELPPEPPEKKPDPPCKNCAKLCSKPLRCGICKAAVYCSADCQKSDWQYHKRTCKKPQPPAPAADSAAPGAGTDAPATAAAEKDKASSSAPARPKADNEKVVEKEDVGNWYKHREWKPDEAPKTFEPSRLDGAPASTPASASSGGKAASEWNAAGTWEEKNMLPWWRKKLETLFKDLGEGGVLQVTKLDKVQGEASIVHVRGQPKFMYDLTFDLPFSGLQRCKACARSAPGSRCSNCVRFQGRVKISDFSWDCDGSPEVTVEHEEAAGPASVKKANAQECRRVAEEELVPPTRTLLKDAVAEYKTLVAGAGPKWQSQLPPSSAPAPSPEAIPAEAAPANVVNATSAAPDENGMEL